MPFSRVNITMFSFQVRWYLFLFEARQLICLSWDSARQAPTRRVTGWSLSKATEAVTNAGLAVLWQGAVREEIEDWSHVWSFCCSCVVTVMRCTAGKRFKGQNISLNAFQQFLLKVRFAFLCVQGFLQVGYGALNGQYILSRPFSTTSP